MDVPAPLASGIVSDAAMVRRILIRAESDQAKVRIQLQKTPTEQKQARFERLDWKAGKFWLDVPVIWQQDEVMLMVLVEGQTLIGIKSQQNADGSFDVPKTLIRIQRRKDHRWVIPGAYEIFVRIGVPRRVIDIGEKGLAFRVGTDAESRKYSIGMDLLKCVFEIHGRKIEVDLEVRNHVDLDKGVKIGTRFTRIAKDDADWLGSFILAQIGHTLI